MSSVSSDNYSNYTNTANRAATPSSGVNGWFGDPSDQQVKVEDFLSLMIEQMKNQDFMNPMDDTQYLTQLAQFSSMQQMQELAYFSKSNYVQSLIGKEVTAAKMKLGGDMVKSTGTVTKVSLINNEFTFFIGDEMFKLDQIMEVKMQEAEKPKPDPEDPDKEETPKT